LSALSGRNVLVIAEIALAFMLLVGSGLMLRSLARPLDTNAGVYPRNLLTVQISLRESNSGFWLELLNRVSSLPAAQSAAIADCPPLIGLCNVKPFWPDGPPVQGGNDPVPIAVHWVTPGYFSALGVPVQRGRAFDERDRVDSPNVVIINETAARKFFPRRGSNRPAHRCGGRHCRRYAGR
jgi:hypothetical protein